MGAGIICCFTMNTTGHADSFNDSQLSRETSVARSSHASRPLRYDAGAVPVRPAKASRGQHGGNTLTRPPARTARAD